MTIMRKGHIYAALAMMLLCGCSKDNPVKDPSSEDSDRAISIIPVMDSGKAATRASLYDSENDLRADLFHTYTYRAGTPNLYLDSEVKYSKEDIDQSKHKWLFYGDGGYRDYYWPLAESLDFFAYAPSSNGYVEVNSAVNPPQFTARMPLSNNQGTVHQGNIKEFLYAYTPGRDKTGGAVPLAFHHPFAGIIFKVEKSQRDLTVKSITIDGIKYEGTCSIDYETGVDTWAPTASTGKLVLTVEKIIPGTVNFGGELCGPYLVLPQKNDGEGKELIIECHWKGYDPSDDVAKDTKILKGRITNEWKSSRIYTYSLDLGNSREEILFSVSIAPWKYVYDHEFEIE